MFTHSCGKVIELEYKLKSYQSDLIGLTEVRWTSGDSHSGHELQLKHGVALILRYIGYILSCTPMNINIVCTNQKSSMRN